VTRSLAVRLTLAFLVVSLLGIVLVAVLAGRFTEREFGAFILRQREAAIVEALAGYYQEHGSWDGLAASGVLAGIVQSQSPSPNNGPERWPVGLGVADVSGALVTPHRGPPGSRPLSAAELAAGTPIEVDGQVVGTLLFDVDEPRNIPPAEAAFLRRINETLILASAGAAIVALLAGGILARTLTGPLRALTHATQAIARGELDQQVEVRSRDEIGELAASFNQMSTDLTRASRLRRRMTADVAHELRAPLSLIRAHAEALRDNVLPPSVETFSLIHDETVRLNRLVDDLRTLSLADAGELTLVRQSVPPGPLLQRAAAAQSVRAQQAGIDLRVEVAPGLPDVQADPDRIAQVLANLLDNALRHTPQGGRIECRAAPAAGEGAVTLTVADSGPGIAAEDLPNIFERFYRADASRQRDGSGSGLGLAIARSIVEAHGGRLWVESQPGAGARFHVELPAASIPAG
jgi:signal transduction histidine kinase